MSSEKESNVSDFIKVKWRKVFSLFGVIGKNCLLVNHQQVYQKKLNMQRLLSNGMYLYPATLEAEFPNGVGVISFGDITPNCSLICGWIAWPPIIQHKERSLTKY